MSLKPGCIGPCFQRSLENNISLFVVLSRLSLAQRYDITRKDIHQNSYIDFREEDYIWSIYCFVLSFVANAFFVAIDALFKKKIINDKVTMVFIHIYLKSRKWSVTYLKQMIKSSAGFILMMESLRELLCQHLLFICEIFNKIKKLISILPNSGNLLSHRICLDLEIIDERLKMKKKLYQV